MATSGPESAPCAGWRRLHGASAPTSAQAIRTHSGCAGSRARPCRFLGRRGACSSHGNPSVGIRNVDKQSISIVTESRRASGAGCHAHDARPRGFAAGTGPVSRPRESERKENGSYVRCFFRCQRCCPIVPYGGSARAKNPSARSCAADAVRPCGRACTCTQRPVHTHPAGEATSALALTIAFLRCLSAPFSHLSLASLSSRAKAVSR